MSAKTTGLIWDLELAVPHRMVLLAMVDHADHNGEHMRAPATFIAWKTGYHIRSVYRIIQDMIAAGILVVTGSALGEANEYKFVLSVGKMKKPYRGMKPKKQATTPDKMSPPTRDKMAGVNAQPPGILAGGSDILSSPPPDILAIDKESSLSRENHIPPPPPLPPTAQNGGGGGSLTQEPTETEVYLLDQQFSDSAAREFRDLDRAACERDIKQARASGQQNGGIIKRWRRSPPRPKPPAPIVTTAPPPWMRDDARSPAETIAALAAQLPARRKEPS